MVLAVNHLVRRVPVWFRRHEQVCVYFHCRQILPVQSVRQITLGHHCSGGLAADDGPSLLTRNPERGEAIR